LGPGGAELLTRQAWQALEAGRELYLRTRRHPAVAELPPHLALHSFDDLYENGQPLEAVYAQIFEQVLALGRRPQGVLYAVPGHPFVAEATASEVVRRARAEGLPVRVIDGLSFLEPVFTALGIDPYPNLALIDGLELAAAHMPNFPPSAPALIAQLHSSLVAAEIKLTLAKVYPKEHPVRLVHAAGTPQQVIEDLTLYEIDHSPHIGPLTSLYLPPLGVETAFEAFQEVVARLRAPDGCPWDREQTHRSLRGDLMEEAYEVLSALDAGDVAGMREELGDLLLLILLHTQIAMDDGEFTMADVLRGIHTKIVYRHPHVFGDVAVHDAGDVLQNWERLKAQERQVAGKTEAGLLDGLPAALPALAQAAQYQKRSARVGFDWPDVKGPLDKLAEEIEEVRQSHGAQTADEIGDLLFSVVNLARWYKVDPESALRETNLRFKRRFGYVEAAARAASRPLTDYSLEELDALWEEGKHELG
jgi:tetrapyrrole methylase family protein/MazG family protein